ncbi:MAG TPA: FeoA family protein [Microbacteriaceae bacterium]|nr:FeoA family protein [Microbacteriaceae bacterium]
MTMLSELASGTSACVASLDQLPAELAQRMRCLGFAPGAEVTTVRRAPLGDPVVYRVCDAEICLRASEARRIEVTALS